MNSTRAAYSHTEVIQGTGGEYVHTEGDPMDSSAAPNTSMTLKSAAFSTGPIALGLAFARVAALVSLDIGSLQNAPSFLLGNNSFTKELVLVAIVILLLKWNPRKDSARLASFRILLRMQPICLVLQGLWTLGLGHDNYASYGVTLIASTIGTLLILMWLVELTGRPARFVLVAVLLARISSELIASLLPLLTPGLLCVVGIGASGFQIACEAVAKKKSDLEELGVLANENYLGSVEGPFREQRFVVASVVGCILLGAAIGFLQSVPEGPAFLQANLSASMSCVLVAFACLCCLMFSMNASLFVVIGVTWFLMQLLGGLAVLMYGTFAADSTAGVVLTETLDSLMGVFKWYITVAIISNARRPPFCNALLLYLMFLLPRNVAHWGSEQISTTLGADPLTVCSWAAFALIVSGQIFFLQVTTIQASPRAKDDVGAPTAVMGKLLGLDTLESPQSSVREQSMRDSARRFGVEFGLSARDEEVLALYALGYTQKAAAEKLFISPHTFHAHIRKVYEKTQLHSRQEILDYMHQADINSNIE